MKNNKTKKTFITFSDSKDSIKLIKETSKKCLHGLPKQVLNLVMYGINKGTKKNCKDDKTKALAYENLGCLNQVLDNLTDVMNTAAAKYRIVNLLPSDIKLNGICCTFYEFQASLKSIGLTKCKNNSVDHLDDLINEFSGEALNLVCSSVTTENCKNFTLPPIEKLDGKIDKTVKEITFIPALLKALTNL